MKSPWLLGDVQWSCAVAEEGGGVAGAQAAEIHPQADSKGLCRAFSAGRDSCRQPLPLNAGLHIMFLTNVDA